MTARTRRGLAFGFRGAGLHLVWPSPARESNPALRLRRPPCRRHTHGERRTKCPRQESNLVHDLRRVVCASVTLQGRSVSVGSESLDLSLGRGHEIFRALVACALLEDPRSLPAGSETHRSGVLCKPVQQGRKDLNPVREFWRLAALPGAHPSRTSGGCCRRIVSRTERLRLDDRERFALIPCVGDRCYRSSSDRRPGGTDWGVGAGSAAEAVVSWSSPFREVSHTSAVVIRLVSSDSPQGVRRWESRTESILW